MATEVLRPHDVLGERFRYPPATFNRRKNFNATGNLTNLIIDRKPNHFVAPKKTSPRSERRKSNTDGGAKKSPRRKDDGVKQVTVLRRGEPLDSPTSKMNGVNPNPSPKLKSPRQKPVNDMSVYGAGRIGPDLPDMGLKQIRLAAAPPLYAGSVCSVSPSPKSVPLPSFFSKKSQNDSDIHSKQFDDSATRDLRRLLRID